MFSYLIALFLVVVVDSRCYGIPTGLEGKNWGCLSICCPNQFVQNPINGHQCISCASVGLLQCEQCGLFSNSTNGVNSTFKCLVSKNIPHLVTKGSISECVVNGEHDTHILNNWTNYDQCSPCSSIIPNSKKCKIVHDCNLTLWQNIGIGCKPRVKVLQCNPGFGIANIHYGLCQSCSEHIYGCITCHNISYCNQCDASFNLTLSADNLSCVCAEGLICNTCPYPHMTFNEQTLECLCKEGYTLELSTCVKILDCTSQNQIYNPNNQSCICKLGYIRNEDDQCQLIQCKQNQELHIQTGKCVCKRGYNVIDSQCVLITSYRAVSKMYNLELHSDNYTIINKAKQYQCSCPAGWTFINGSCTPCPLIGKQCPCAQGWTFKDGQCVACDLVQQTGCVQCNQINQPGLYPQRKCQRCSPGFRLIENPKMPWGSKCLRCDNQCTECQQSQQIVPTCKSCPSASLLIQNSFCIDCWKYIKNCMKCDLLNPGNNIGQRIGCITCNSPYIPSADGRTCVCPSPNNSGNNTCISCHFGCIECSGTICLQCRPGMILNPFGTGCICSSPQLSINNFCQDCISNIGSNNIQGCIYCSSKQSCANCSDGYVLTDGHCEICSRYIPGCISCQSKNICTQCDSSSNFILENDICVCRSHYLLLDKQCKNCSEIINGCIQCSDFNTCLTCNQSINFQLGPNNKCKCSTGYLFINQTCLHCDQIIPGCASCDNSSECRQCKIGYSRNEQGSCQCDSGYTRSVNGQCVICSMAYQNCYSCNQTNCLSCNKYFTLNITQNVCQQQFSTPDCGPRCDRCQKGLCTVCHDTATLFNGFCICKDSWFQNKTTGQCDKCFPLCNKCYNTTICYDCYKADNHTLDNCTCERGYWMIPVAIKCLPCTRNCYQCSGNWANCTACNTTQHRQLVNNQCPCMQGYKNKFPDDPMKFQDKDCIPI